MRKAAAFTAVATGYALMLALMLASGVFRTRFGNHWPVDVEDDEDEGDD